MNRSQQLWIDNQSGRIYVRGRDVTNTLRAQARRVLALLYGNRGRRVGQRELMGLFRYGPYIDRDISWGISHIRRFLEQHDLDHVYQVPRRTAAGYMLVGDEPPVSEFVAVVEKHMSAVIAAIRVYEHWSSSNERRQAETLVANLQTELIRLVTADDESIIERLGMVQAATRNIEQHARTFVITRVRAAFSEKAFESLLGNVVSFGLGLAAGKAF